MRIQLLGSAVAASAALALSVGASSTLGQAGDTAATSASGAVSATIEAVIQPEDAARLAKQASFGPTPALINAIVAKKTAAAWIDEQLGLRTSTYADLASPVVGTICNGLSGTAYTQCGHRYLTADPVIMRFYTNAVGNDDQLRQRVAFALSQIIVASESEVHNTAGLAAFQQILLGNAFGNYRDILKAATMSSYMGDYLDMADSNKTDPNENYARELMQLFSVGTVLLNPDGTPQTDNTGAPIAAYTNSDVKEVARALTGWTYSRVNTSIPLDYYNRDYTAQQILNPARFDTGAKTFLGKTVPASASQQANVDAAVDAVFNHPNTGPYICKRLIQQLTVANPTPAYIGRVAAVFANNGAGVRGDLKAVVRAIYLDSEARTVSQLPGKVKEPVLVATSLARAIGFKTDGFAFMYRDAGMGQQPFRAPSVFNFYPYEFPLPQGGGLVSPVSKIVTTSSNVARHNFVYDWTILGDGDRNDYKPGTAIVADSTGTAPDWASWEAYGADDGKILDRINLVLLNGTMTKTQRQSLLTAMAAVKNNNPALQTRKRAQMALYIVASSPLFQVDR